MVVVTRGVCDPRGLSAGTFCLERSPRAGRNEQGRPRENGRPGTGGGECGPRQQRGHRVDRQRQRNRHTFRRAADDPLPYGAPTRRFVQPASAGTPAFCPLAARPPAESAPASAERATIAVRGQPQRRDGLQRSPAGHGINDGNLRREASGKKVARAHDRSCRPHQALR